VHELEIINNEGFIASYSDQLVMKVSEVSCSSADRFSAGLTASNPTCCVFYPLQRELGGHGFYLIWASLIFPAISAKIGAATTPP